MATRVKRTAKGTHMLSSVLSNLPQYPHRVGLPAKDSIISVSEPVRPLSMAAAPSSRTFRIIHTNEMDEYEKSAGSPFAFAAVALPTGDKFHGTSRKAAKVSIANSTMEAFDDLRELIESLEDEETMIDHEPEIGTDAKSNRVKEEKRNVRVQAFIYAASRESDNDFHLIVGRDPETSPEMYMTMELSGLPPSSSPAFKKLTDSDVLFGAIAGGPRPKKSEVPTHVLSRAPASGTAPSAGFSWDVTPLVAFLRRTA